MNTKLIHFVLLVAVGMMLAGWQNYATGQEVDAKLVAGIEKAMPDKPVAAPQKPRALLVFDLSKGFQHSCIPVCAKMLDIMAAKTGAFKVTHSVDYNDFRAENLAKYDAILFNNTTSLAIDDPALRQSIMDFIKGGKGIIGIHAATDNFGSWPEAAEMMGGQFDGHPWGGGGTWAIKLDKPNHPFNASFEGKGFKLKDEIYRSKGYSRTRVQVLVGLDLTDKETSSPKDIRPADKEIAISWIRDYGKGRLFYCSLGHNHEVYTDTAILKHYLAGIQYALGDNPADGTPDVQRAVKGVAAYNAGDSREALNDLQDYIRYVSGNAVELKAIEKIMLQALQGTVTEMGRDFLCRELSIIGGDATVEALAPMLARPETNNVARYALERIPGSKSDAALLKALGETQGAAKAGVINSLGARRCEAAVASLTGLLSDKDEAIKGAVIQALGRIGNAAAGKALEGAQISGPMQALVMDAQVRVAGQQLAGGDKQAAVATLTKLAGAASPATIRVAAMTAMLAEPQGVAAVKEAIADKDPQIYSPAIQISRQIKDASITAALVGALDKVAPAAQAEILAALADRRDASAVEAVVKMAASPEAGVKLQAIRALEALGNGSTVLLLAETATRGEDQLKNAAREALNRMDSAETNPAIVKALETAPDEVKMTLLNSLAERSAKEAFEPVLKMTLNSNAGVAREAYKTIKTIGTYQMAPAVVAQMLQCKSGSVRQEAVRTITALAMQNPQAQQRAQAVLAGMEKTDDVEIKCSLMRALGVIGDPAGLPVLKSALEKGAPNVQAEAIRAMTDWPDAAPLNDLLAVTEKAEAKNNQILAIRGSARLLEMDGRSAEDKTALYAKLMGLTDNADTRKQILSGVGKIGHSKSLELAQSFLSDSALQSEAALAVISIADMIKDQQAEVAKKALNAVMTATNDNNLKDKANEVLRKIK